MSAQELNLTEPKSSVTVTDDREACSKFWIAAYTRPRSEKKAATELTKKYQIETYVPLQTVERQWSDRKKEIEVVVIPMIIFAEVSRYEEILEIKKHPLIIKVLTLPGHKEAAHIPNDQIEQLRLMLKKSEKNVEFVEYDFKKYDHVRVIRGHLAGLDGVVEMADDGRAYIIIKIDMLGGAKASIDPSDITIISKDSI